MVPYLPRVSVAQDDKRGQSCPLRGPRLSQSFNDCNEFGRDGDLVERWCSAIHRYARHDLARERVFTKKYRVHSVVVMEGSNGFRNKSGLRIGLVGPLS